MGGAVEHGNRHIVFLRIGDDGRGAFAVLRDQDDAVHALSDAVVDLFELTIGIFVGVAFQNRMALFGQRRGDGKVACNPEFGFQVLKGKADGCGLRRKRDRPPQAQAPRRLWQSVVWSS